MFIRFCLFFKKNDRLIAADLSKKKALDPDSRAVQQIIFTGKQIIQLGFITSKETMPEFAKGTTKVL